jgi:hypothetical protein
MKFVPYVWAVFEKLLAFFLRSQIDKQGIYVFLVYEICGKNIDFKEEHSKK